MKVTTWEQCQELAAKIGIPAILIAEAHGVYHNDPFLNRIEKAATQDELWKIFEETENGSVAEGKVILKLFQHASDNSERLKILSRVDPRSDVAEYIIAAIFHTMGPEERWLFFEKEGTNRELQILMLRSLFWQFPTSIEDKKRVFEKAREVMDIKLQEEAIRAICENFEPKPSPAS